MTIFRRDSLDKVVDLRLYADVAPEYEVRGGLADARAPDDRYTRPIMHAPNDLHNALACPMCGKRLILLWITMGRHNPRLSCACKWYVVLSTDQGGLYRPDFRSEQYDENYPKKFRLTFKQRLAFMRAFIEACRINTVESDDEEIRSIT